MFVAVMQVGHVGMRVPQRLVRMLVDVRLGPLVAMVRVLMVLVVNVPVSVHLMPVLVFV